MNDIKIFKSEQFGEIRTTGTSDNPMFCLSDVCKLLGLESTSKVKQRLRTPGVNTREVGVQTGVRSDGTPVIQKVMMTFIDEPNLYRTIFMSRRQEAEAFQDWVTSEVLPSIRKTGKYAVEQQSEMDKVCEALAIVHRREQEKARLLEMKEAIIEKQTEELKHAALKVIYYDKVLAADGTVTTKQLAQTIGARSAQWLNQKLADLKIQYKESKMWKLYSRYADMGLATTRTNSHCDADGKEYISLYTVWTPKGMRFICELASNGWNVKEAIRVVEYSSLPMTV